MFGSSGNDVDSGGGGGDCSDWELVMVVIARVEIVVDSAGANGDKDSVDNW